MKRRTARGAASKGLVLAMIFGIAGGGLAAWAVMSTGREKRPIGPPRVEPVGGPQRDGPGPNGPGIEREVAGPRNDPPPADPATFAPVQSDGDVEALLSEMRAAVSSLAGADQSLASMGAEAQGKLAEHYALAMSPYLRGDADAIATVARQLGAPASTPSDESPNPPERPAGRSPLMALLKHASIDVSKAKVLPYDPKRGEMPMEGERDNGGRTAVIGMRTSGVYPEIDDFERKKMRAVEVRAPLLVQGEKPTEPPTMIGAIMVWNPTARSWQPLQINIMSSDDQALRSMMGRAMRGN